MRCSRATFSSAARCVGLALASLTIAIASSHAQAPIQSTRIGVDEKALTAQLSEYQVVPLAFQIPINSKLATELPPVPGVQFDLKAKRAASCKSLYQRKHLTYGQIAEAVRLDDIPKADIGRTLELRAVISAPAASSLSINIDIPVTAIADAQWTVRLLYQQTADDHQFHDAIGAISSLCGEEHSRHNYIRRLVVGIPILLVKLSSPVRAFGSTDNRWETVRFPDDATYLLKPNRPFVMGVGSSAPP